MVCSGSTYRDEGIPDQVGDDGNVTGRVSGDVMAGFDGNIMVGFDGNVTAGLDGNIMAGFDGDVMAGLTGHLWNDHETLPFSTEDIAGRLEALARDGPVRHEQVLEGLEDGCIEAVWLKDII